MTLEELKGLFLLVTSILWHLLQQEQNGPPAASPAPRKAPGPAPSHTGLGMPSVGPGSAGLVGWKQAVLGPGFTSSNLSYI